MSRALLVGRSLVRTLGSGLLMAGVSSGLLSAAQAAPKVYVAYPAANARVAFDHVILEGSVTPGASLNVGGQSVNVAPDGLFMLWWPLKRGVNDLRLVATQAGQSGRAALRVTRTDQPPLPATPTAIARGSVLPGANVEFWDAPGDSAAERGLDIRFQGSPGGRATAQVAGLGTQPLTEGPAGTYSGRYVLPEQLSLRNAALTVRLTGRDGRTVSAAATGRVSSILGNLKTGVQKPGTVKGLGINDAQNYLTDLDGGPALYPRDGMTFRVVGRQGPDLRVRLAPGRSVLVGADQLNVLPGQPGLAISGPLTLDGAAPVSAALAARPAAQTVVQPLSQPPVQTAGTTAQLGSAVPGAASASATTPTAPAASGFGIPATPATLADQSAPDQTPTDPATASGAASAQAPASGFGLAPSAPSVSTSPTPAEIVPTPASPAPVPAPLTPTAPSVTPSGDLRLRLPLGGARVPFQVEQTGPGQLTLTLYGLLTPPTPPTASDPLIARIGVQPGQGWVRVVLDLNTAQLWGFTANYDGSDLVLGVRRPPALSAARPLSGRTLTIDPGHGGTQNGGAGSFGIPEKGLVLPIALRVAELLRTQGATVNLTRTGDVTLGLYERDLSAEATRSDLLVSIHANALPDGRNPAGIRGPEVYFTHPQAQAIGAAILGQLRRQIPELGPGAGLMPNANLALTRPTTQPSLLIETAYLTDPGNLRALNSPAGQEKFAQAIAAGILDFYRSQVR